jgi:hypothetical protein
VAGRPWLRRVVPDPNPTETVLKASEWVVNMAGTKLEKPETGVTGAVLSSKAVETGLKWAGMDLK